MIVLPYGGVEPRIGEGTYIAPNATLIGDVEVGNDCSIWFGTVLRGDVHRIQIGPRTNIQDNCVVHVTSGVWPVIIAEEVTIGHGVIAHGCMIKRRALVGMGSRILDGAVIDEYALVAAGALVPEGMHVPPNTLVAGVPARIKRELTAEEILRLDMSWKNYVTYKDDYLKGTR
ncbi:MAG TPA: gamma carbonic anhydrase family protein [Thermoanaerobaculia bacterium]|nr:gamma carbonic anhydrase family protein [Thermoanaerobaculia bacterium]